MHLVGEHVRPFIEPLAVVHLRIGIIASHKPFPSWVNEYSTLGGISEWYLRFTKPSLWSCFNVSESVFGLTIFSCSSSSLNLASLLLPIAFIISSAHFLPRISITASSGHCAVSFSFSVSYTSFRGS